MEPQARTPRLRAVRRADGRVTALELFFDLVFVLAVTQCTTLMANHATWNGLLRGLLVLAVLWWPWTGYAWLTSVVDPEEGAVRLAMFAAMAAFLVAALAVPGAFGDDAFAFACAYGVVRAAHIWLFLIASRDEPGLRRSVTGLAASSAGGVALLLAASSVDGLAQGALWALALVVDVGMPLLFWSEGWQLMPRTLRRALRADRDHRAGRVDRRDRSRLRTRSSTSGSSSRRRSGWPSQRRSGGCTST